MVDKFPEAMQITGVTRPSGLDKKAEDEGHDMEKLSDLCKNNINQTPTKERIPVLNHHEQNSSVNQLHVVAPGGQNHLTDERRKKKICDLEYFKQKLFNENPT